MKKTLATFLGSVLLGSISLSLTMAPGTAQAQLIGDAKAGATKATACSACHGPKGISATAQFPNLAGQVPGYISKQLAKFKSGKRKNPIMQGMAAGLSEQDMADIDAYFASLEGAVGAVPKDQAASAKRGAQLYRGGDMNLGIPACMACHGPSGRGIPPHFPRVAGQKQQYLVSSLKAFKAKERPSYNEIMTHVAFLLTPRQMEDLAAFMHALQ